jgi:hypothetical protein
MRKKYLGKVKDGILILNNQEAYDINLKLLEGKDVEISIGEKSKTRSDSQNRYFHGVPVVLISGKTGMDKEETKEYLKQRFSPKKRITIKGKETIIVKGTSKMSTKEFCDFIDRIQRFASEEIDLFIPSPDEVDIEYLEYN